MPITRHTPAELVDHLAQIDHLAQTAKGRDALEHILQWMCSEALSLDAQNWIASMALLNVCREKPSTRNLIREALGR